MIDQQRPVRHDIGTLETYIRPEQSTQEEHVDKQAAPKRNERDIATRVKAARKLVKGTSDGPWVRWRGAPHVMQGPAKINTESTFQGSVPHGDGTIAECDADPCIPDRRKQKNAAFIAKSRTLVPELADDAEQLLARLNEYREAVRNTLRFPTTKRHALRLRDLLSEDGIEV